MNDEQLGDIKDWITTSANQTEVRLIKKIDESAATLRAEMHDGFKAIADVIDRHNDELDNHHKRITKLETKLA